MAKILVIDDDGLVREVIARILRDAAHVVLTAEDGRRGLALFRSEQPDLVITDILMPEQEGIQTLMDIRQVRPDAKVIAISGGGLVGNTGSLEIARALGATDIITKPFDPEDLVRRVGQCLAA